MPVLDAGAGGLSLGELVRRLSAATTPLLIRGLLDKPGWLEQAAAAISAVSQNLSQQKALLESGAVNPLTSMDFFRITARS